jgi:hypothetical protein
MRLAAILSISVALIACDSRKLPTAGDGGGGSSDSRAWPALDGSDSSFDSVLHDHRAPLDGRSDVGPDLTRADLGPSQCLGGAGNCGAMGYCKASTCGALGSCEARPDDCPTIHATVCGCDNKTYGNACKAAKAGVTAAKSGPCDGNACTTSAQCGVGQFCRFISGACTGTGKCESRPGGCPEVLDWVCGCNGVDYQNECEAHAAGVNVAQKGKCPAPPKQCRTTAECGRGYFCNRDKACDPQAQGKCEPIPNGCGKILAPVCSCNGKTYTNACEAHRAGESVYNDRECKDVSTCDMLEIDYQKALVEAKKCAPMAPAVQCETLVAMSLKCGCNTFVSRSGAFYDWLRLMQRTFKGNGCDKRGWPCPLIPCFLPTSARCDLQTASCKDI